MKGIVLAGGSGTRLYPMTRSLSKQLLPIYDKPMIYYPLSILMEAGIREVMLISTPRDLPVIQDLLKDGSELGMKLEYKIQEAPRGIAEAFILAAPFVGESDVALILGDNLFHGDLSFFTDAVKAQINGTDSYRAHVFGYPVENPNRYGVVEFDEPSRKVLSIEEKPEVPKSKFAISGLYIFDRSCVRLAEQLMPSARGELEITDLMKAYLAEDALCVHLIGESVKWLDAGTVDSLFQSSEHVAQCQRETKKLVGSIHETALRRGFVSQKQFEQTIVTMPSCEYRLALEAILSGIG